MLTIKHPREWSLGSYLMLASGLVLLGVCVALVAMPQHSVSSPGTVRDGQITKNEDMNNDFKVEYPIFNVEKVDAAIRSYANKIRDTHTAKSKAQPTLRRQLTLTYEIVHYGERTVTVVFYGKEKTANKPVIMSQNIMTFDLQTQAQLAFTDLFTTKAKARKALANLLYDYFKANGATFSPLEKMKILSFKLRNVHDFALYKDTLTLHLNPHNLPSNKNTETVAIKKSLLSTVLKKEYALPDGERQPDKGKKPAYFIAKKPKRAERISPNSKLIALTFDDGPGAHTSRLLDVLKAHRAHATFFVLGSLVQGHADSIKRAIAEGNEIGNHSWNHPDLTLLPPDQLRQQVGDTQAVIRQITGGYTPVAMRPPYGIVNDQVRAYLRSQGLVETLWNADPGDWLDRDAQVVHGKIMEAAGDGRTLVLHDIYPSSVDGVARAVPDLIAEGYKLVTVSEMRALRK